MHKMRGLLIRGVFSVQLHLGQLWTSGSRAFEVPIGWFSNQVTVKPYRTVSRGLHTYILLYIYEIYISKYAGRQGCVFLVDETM